MNSYIMAPEYSASMPSTGDLASFRTGSYGRDLDLQLLAQRQAAQVSRDEEYKRQMEFAQALATWQAETARQQEAADYALNYAAGQPAWELAKSKLHSMGPAALSAGRLRPTPVIPTPQRPVNPSPQTRPAQSQDVPGVYGPKPGLRRFQRVLGRGGTGAMKAPAMGGSYLGQGMSKIPTFKSKIVL